MRNRRATAGLLPIAITGLLMAQQPSAHQPAPQEAAPSNSAPNAYTLQLNKQAVVLDIVVTNSKGDVVTNLKKEDFWVFEDKLPQVVQTFDPPPLTLPNLPVHSTAELDRVEPYASVNLIVLDEINTRFQDEAFARYSLKRFLDRKGDALERPTLLGAVDMNHFTLLQDFTTSKQDLLNALEHHLAVYPWHLEGTTWKSEQFNASFAALLEIAKATSGHPGHKSLIWVGRGFPPFDPESLSEQQGETLKRVIETCTNALRDARVALYTLDPAGVSTEPPAVDSDGFIIDPFDGVLDFSTMAQETGGHAFYGRNDVDDLIATSTRDGSSFYTISYTPAIPQTDTRAFHSIRVAVKDPELHVETREGYYSPPDHALAGSGTVNKPGSKPGSQLLDLALAAQSAMPYDGVHMTVNHVSGNPDQFRITLASHDLSWSASGSQELITKVTVIAESFDKKGQPLNRAMKISTLQVGVGSLAGSPASATVSLFSRIPALSPAARIRFLIRDEASQRIGTVNLPLTGKEAADHVSN